MTDDPRGGLGSGGGDACEGGFGWMIGFVVCCEMGLVREPWS